MDKSFFSFHKDRLIHDAPDIIRFQNGFRSVNKRWNCAITAGMIEAGSMSDETSRLFEPLLKDMKATKASYGEIQNKLVDTILFEMVRKTVLEINDSAKFVINILKRNLFERTADVGYLATDADIVDFLKKGGGSSHQADRQEREIIRQRLADYRHEYTVYNEIIVLDTSGCVRVNLDDASVITHSKDPLLGATQSIDLRSNATPYVETYGPSDLRPGKGSVLIYSQKIVDPGNGRSLGTLCLCFDFELEMDGIFRDMRQGNEHMILAILNGNGHVMTSSDESVLSIGRSVNVDLNADCMYVNFGGKPYLASTVATDGYQGFMGLTWYGLAMIGTGTAFRKSSGQNGSPLNGIAHDLHFSSDLSSIKKQSDDLLEDMKLDSINGQIRAMECFAKAFVEVLYYVKSISCEIDGILGSAIGNLQETVVSSLFNEVQFRAFQGNNIADRNLYERANDVCWWALTPMFRNLLTQHGIRALTGEERKSLKDNLQYINNLYTPYLRLVLADTRGEIIAVSDPPEGLSESFAEEGLPKGQDFVGLKMDPDIVTRALRLGSSRDYCVSEFKPTPLYGGRPTYIYATAVRDPENTRRCVGVIGIVFDSEPQFNAMLMDALPQNRDNPLEKSGFGIFVDRKKTVISSTHPDYPVGSKLPLDDSFFRHPVGHRYSGIVTLDSGAYALGLQVSEGYREYKRGDGYDNEIVCMIFVPV